MLSKVIGRGDAGSAEAMVFPNLTGHERASVDRYSYEESPGGAGKEGSGAESEGLREKLRQLQSQTALELREAFEAGKRQGEEQARAEFQPVLERLNTSITEVLAMRPGLRLSAERDVVQLALLIARKVLHRQLSVDEEALNAIARVAFERLTRSESYRVTVHPQFATAVTSALAGSHSARVQICADPNTALGTLTIHSAEGTIDASVDVQLEEISRGLADRLSVL
jgi:flagellar assembly protein FliH